MSNGEAINFDYIFKYIIIGDAAVGKSNLLLRYSYGQFKPEYQLTIGVEFGTKNLEIKNKLYRIQIWDTAGQENFRSITRAYYKNSICALVVYDISSRDTFNNASTWIEECRNQCAQSTFMVLVGNKLDLEEKRQVSTEEGEELANRFGMLFYETSAKDGTNVEKIFCEPANQIAQNIENDKYDLEDENIGIKQGINRTYVSNKTTKLKNEKNKNDGKKGKKCC